MILNITLIFAHVIVIGSMLSSLKYVGARMFGRTGFLLLGCNIVLCLYWVIDLVITLL